MTGAVPSYAVAFLRDVEFGDDIIAYLREIDRTLVAFGGEFIVHGGDPDVREGQKERLDLPDRAGHGILPDTR